VSPLRRPPRQPPDLPYQMELTMITVLLIAVALVFGVVFGHVVGFGVRPRRPRPHERPVNRSDEHDRRWVELPEARRPDADLPPCRLTGDR
jgi:hypothetical protein